MSLALKIAKNTTYLAIGKIISTAIGILTLALLLRYLSPDDYGRYTTVLAFILLFGTFLDLGLNLSTTQDISLPGQDAAKTLSSIFTFRLLINTVLVLFLPLILLLFPYEQMVKQAILITSVLFFTQSLFQVLSSYFQKELQAGKVAIAELGGRAALLITTLIAVFFHFTFLSLMLTVAIAGLVQLWTLLRYTSSAIALRLTIDWPIVKRIMAKTWPIALSVIFTTVYFKGDTVILSLVRPYQDVGIYGAAYKILEVLITLPILFMGLILPQLSHSFAQGDLSRFSRLLQKTWDALALLALPMTAGVLILASPIINLIAGPGYEDSARVLRILILATAIIFLGALFTHAIVAINEQKTMIKYYGLTAILAIILYIIYIPTYTYFAAAWITVLAEFLVAGVAFYKVRQKSEFRLSLSVFGKAMAASLVMAGILYLLSRWNVLILIGVGAIIYITMLFVLKAVPDEFIKRYKTQTNSKQIQY